jgi:hypothetical protein
MENFEVHKLTTFEEIRLSRSLANAVRDAEKEMSLPISILLAMEELDKLYKRQIEMGIQ